MADSPFHNPFGALRPLREKLEREAPAAPATQAATDARATDARASDTPSGKVGAAGTPGPLAGKGPARAVVRLERAGRGGKDVTVIEQLGLNSTQMAAWLKALKSALGCGGVLEDGAIVLQGDHRKRLPEILTKRGVRKVTTG